MALDVGADREGHVAPAGARRARYLPIAEHGLIDDLHTAASSATILGIARAAVEPSSLSPREHLQFDAASPPTRGKRD